ncbi:MAG: hypothetical protein ACPGFK_05450 [Flavobacteriaceae bacterium]
MHQGFQCSSNGVGTASGRILVDKELADEQEAFMQGVFTGK